METDFDGFVAARSTALFRGALVLTGNRDAAEDLVQETLERACRKWRTDLHGERTYSRAAAYGQSRPADLIFTYELQRRLAARGTTVAVAAHPGLSSTEFARNIRAVRRLPVTWLAPLITARSRAPGWSLAARIRTSQPFSSGCVPSPKPSRG